jgi:serine/threonine-protein kinase RIO1
VHGDVSEYNILVRNDELVIIDVGQAVLYDHPMAKEFLVHDIENISRYFRTTYGIKVNPEKLIQEVLDLREEK